MYVRMMFRYYVVMAGTGLAAFAMMPTARVLAARMREHWRRIYTIAALATACVLMSTFLIWAGRRQFGAFDYNILIDTGWRQILGQRPYVDFVTSTPPGFNLGMKFADELFGVTWNANLYLSALFTCVSFLWLFWLMTKLEISRLAAMLTAISIECAVMLDVCFWWYNNTTLILATVFFLSCLMYAREPRPWRFRLSYAASLALLVLMKPNIAGVTALGGIILLLVVTKRRADLLRLTVAACASAVLLLLAEHISITAMLASYHGASLERGGLTKFAYDQMNHFAQWTGLAWVAVVSLPLLSLLPRAADELHRRDRRGLAYILFFPLSVIIALYGIATNGDYRELDCSVLLAAGAVVTFGMDLPGPLLRRAYVAILLAGSVSDLYLGAMRARVYTIGPHQFFEWADHGQRVESGFLKDMRVSSVLVHLEQEVARAKTQNAGPYFFGPRIDFNYAVLGLPSPEHLPVWWHPGTAFARRETPHLLQVWQAQGFKTLIFLKGDYTFYPPEFMDLIHEGYVEDDSYMGLTVYHARSIR